MFELANLKHVEPRREEVSEKNPVEYQPVALYGAADEAEYLYQRPKFEDGEVFSYFKSRRISRTWISYWVILQGVLLFFQLFLYAEVSSHSRMYDATIHRECNAEKVGSCKSRIWQTRQDVTHYIHKDVHNLETPVLIDFKTLMWAPTAVQVSVIADPPELHLPYQLHLVRHPVGNHTTERVFHEYRTTGINSVYIEEGQTGKSVFVTAEWEGTLQLVQYPTRFSRGKSYAPVLQKIANDLNSVRVVATEMNSIELGLFRHAAPMCDVKKSWNNVMVHSMDVGSGRLSWIKHCLGLSILVSMMVTFFVWSWYSGRHVVEGVKFHYLVAAKTILQDLPLQAIVLWYIFSWYEGGGGEKCQLCVLDYAHCEKMNPLHFTNFMVVMAVIASSLSNQFLFSADPSSLRTEDDRGFVVFVRIILISVSILPFSTAMIAFNASLIQLPGLVHTVFLLPCFAGWVGLFSLLCFPITTLVDDDEYFLY